MPSLPAICLNPECGLIFQSAFFVEGSGISFTNCSSGPCPRCGSQGRIPDGAYDGIGNKLFAVLSNISDINILKEYSFFLSNQVRSGISPAIIQDSVNKQYPELKSISDVIPKTRSDAYAFIGILLTLISLTLDRCEKRNTKEPDIQVKQEIVNQSFQNFYISGDSVRVYVQSNNHTELNTK